MQNIIVADNEYRELVKYIKENGYKNIFLVCDDSIRFLRINDYLRKFEEELGIVFVYFSDFHPNPLYESVVKGVCLFTEKNCDAIFAIGGGSAMDVAKCIKLYSNMNRELNYLKQEIIPNNIPLIAMPTTSGTGSEATRFAVIYYQGEKQSVSDYSCIPSVVIMDADALRTVPQYQRKSTMLDAFCHAIESFWSVNSTEESKEYSRNAISIILKNLNKYLDNIEDGNSAMLQAANYAGKAINITQTTAGHAMCYKLTSLYGIAHGHAAALCISKLWPYMIEHTELCRDPRGRAYLVSVFEDIAKAMDVKTSQEAVMVFQRVLHSLELSVPTLEDNQLELLCKSVAPERLKNNPVVLSDDSIKDLYCQILGKEV